MPGAVFASHRALDTFIHGRDIARATGEPPARERTQAFDFTRARSVLGWAPVFTLENAVADYVREAQSEHTAGSE